MDDRTVPLPGVSVKNEIKIKKPNQYWGADLHYRALFEQTGECVFIIGLDLCYIAANQQALGLLGYEEHELIGKPVSEIMSLDDELGQETFVGNNSNLYERILNQKDGSKLPVEISTSIVYNEKNEPAYIQSIARDISERKNAEQILRRHTRILSAISDATARLLRTSNIEKMIPEVLESLGRAIDVSCCVIFEIDTFSTNPSNYVQYEWQKQASAAKFDISTLTGSAIPAILNITANGIFSSIVEEEPDLNLFPNISFAIMPIHDTLGSRAFIGLFDQKKNLFWSDAEREAIQTAANLIGSALQRNQYEETIRLSEVRNRIIIDALPDLIIRVDIDGTILDYSANPEHPLFVHRDVIAGKKLSETWPEETVEKIVGGSNKEAFTAAHWVEGFHFPYSNNIYEARLSPISMNEALIVIRDVTEQERLNEAKSDFINRASHELRTPLTSAILMIELIREGGSPDELKEYWEILDSELNRQKILIDRLLIAGRLEHGMMKLDRVPLDLIPVLKESVLAVKPIANKRKVSIQLTAEDDELTILGDKSGLQQVFINLINNAVKFSPEQGQVDVEVLKTQTDVQIRITDSGLGIPSDALPHLFERFYRAKNVTIAEIPGSGIGLYIVKSIVDGLGGIIAVDSELNKGTTFTVTLEHG